MHPPRRESAPRRGGRERRLGRRAAISSAVDESSPVAPLGHAYTRDTCRKRVARAAAAIASAAAAAAASSQIVQSRPRPRAERDCPSAIRALATSAHGSRGPLFFAKGLANFGCYNSSSDRLLGCHASSSIKGSLVGLAPRPAARPQSLRLGRETA